MKKTDKSPPEPPQTPLFSRAPMSDATVKTVRLRPEQHGLKTALFDLEAQVMDIIWSRGWQRFNVADVQRELGNERDLAYTTVMTTVARLFDKGLLAREREGKRYIYCPRLSRESFSQTVAREVLRGLSQLDHGQTVALLAQQVTQADLAELDQLEALIRRRREELER